MPASKNYIFLFLLVLLTAVNVHGQEKLSQKMHVSYLDDRLKILFTGDKKQTNIQFFPCGVNQIYAIGQVDYYDSIYSDENAKPDFSYQSGTDWIGPYFVCLSGNTNKGLPQRFTGGWHGSNGDGIGKPTAQTQSVKITANGKTVLGNFNGIFDSLQVEVINFIQGFDDSTFSRPILKEKVNYTLTPDARIHVKVVITALTDITIQRYYGMQSVNFAIFDSVTYASSHLQLNTAPIKANSRCSSNDKTNTILLKDISGKHHLKLVLGNSGLGDFEHLAEELPKAFSAAYGKSYFNLIHGKDLSLKEGESVFWEGTYYFH